MRVILTINVIIWDYNKEITVTLEDALFSAKSMAIMFGNGDVDVTAKEISHPIKFTGESSLPTVLEENGKQFATSGAKLYSGEDMKAVTTTDSLDPNLEYIAVCKFTPETYGKIEINANTFPGTYKVVGDTYARSEKTGKDEFFQFVIHKAKVLAENTITLEAEGDPSVFNLNLKVLRPSSGPMMELIKYDMAEANG